jgi:hypothetical protein
MNHSVVCDLGLIELFGCQNIEFSEGAVTSKSFSTRIRAVKTSIRKTDETIRHDLPIRSHLFSVALMPRLQVFRTQKIRRTRELIMVKPQKAALVVHTVEKKIGTKTSDSNVMQPGTMYSFRNKNLVTNVVFAI